jgi:type III pantothenate kinase
VILQLDLGNSALKWRCWGPEGALARGSLPVAGPLSLPELSGAPQDVWVASVAGPAANAELVDLVSQRWQLGAWFAQSEAFSLGVTNSYQEPSRMGVDRWLAMIAAWHRIGDAFCVVDAGSALTIDFVDASGCHRGGYIVPGVAMMERSLLGETARVRFDEAPRDRMVPGTSTESAVFNGLQLAQVGAIALALDRFGQGEALVFTGGTGRQAQRLLARGGDFVEDLVLDGLSLLGGERRAGEAQRA